jgi:hypothetical protein
VGYFRVAATPLPHTTSRPKTGVLPTARKRMPGADLAGCAVAGVPALRRGRLHVQDAFYEPKLEEVFPDAAERQTHRHHLQGTAYQGYRRGRGSLRADVYFCRLSKDTQAIAAKTTPAALSASVRIVSRGMPNSSCATLPVIIAAIAAVAKAMMRKATLPPMPMSPDNSEMRSGSPPG